jgi:hypothetical protein
MCRFLCCDSFVDVAVLTASDGDGEESGGAAFDFAGLIGSVCSESVVCRLG